MKIKKNVFKFKSGQCNCENDYTEQVQAKIRVGYNIRLLCAIPVIINVQHEFPISLLYMYCLNNICFFFLYSYTDEIFILPILQRRYMD